MILFSATVIIRDQLFDIMGRGRGGGGGGGEGGGGGRNLKIK